IDRGDGSDGFKINADIPLLSRRYGGCDGTRDSTSPRRRSCFGIIAMMQDQNEDQTQNRERDGPYEKALPFGLRRITSRRHFELGVSGKSGGSVFHSVCFHHQISESSNARTDTGPICGSGESSDLLCRVDEMHFPHPWFAKAFRDCTSKWEHRRTPGEVKNHRQLVNVRKRRDRRVQPIERYKRIAPASARLGASRSDQFIPEPMFCRNYQTQIPIPCRRRESNYLAR